MTGAELEITIYGPGWTAARHRLASVRPAEARALLASAMDRVESGWTAILPLHQWLERNRGRDSAEDDYGCLLTYAETEVRETFRSMALALAHVAADWPEWERASTEDVAGLLSTFVRYVTVLGLATDAATVPPEFGRLVRQVAPLGLTGEWFHQLSGVVQAIERRATAPGTVQDAQAAVEFLTAALPEAERARASAALLTNVEALYALAGPPPPEWLDLLREYFAGRAHEANPPQECGG
ncbi:hypothetical protein [Longimicrobium sp.]|uniref:hypothetical protein n=1 Tax=Longimicrobium sp. TaxID=2029185 RepID=UPI003B3BDC56